MPHLNLLRRTLMAALWAALALARPAEASLQIAGTRVILNGKDREVSVSVTNAGALPYVIQTWIESDDETQTGVPLLVTPPLSRLDPGKENLLRVMRVSGNVPTDRESVFRLNIKEIPVKPGEDNYLQIALRNRLKIFYRPQGLPGRADTAREQLQLSVVPDSASRGAMLRVVNPSAYHITFTAFTIDGGAEEVDADMVPPMGELRLPLKSVTTPRAIDVSFTTINDYGGETLSQQVRAEVGPPPGATPAVATDAAAPQDGQPVRAPIAPVGEVR